MKSIKSFVFLFFLCFTGLLFSQNDKSLEEKKKIIAEDHVINAALAEMKENYAEAILEYQDALRLDPQPSVHFAISKCYIRIHKYPQALNHARAAVEGEGDNVEFLTLLGSIYAGARKVDSAEVIYKKIIEVDPENVQAYYNLGQQYEANKPLQALEIYKKLLEITGPEWTVLVKIADLNERMGNIDATIEIIEELVDLNPSSLELQKLLIQSLIKNDNYDKALARCDDVLILFPNDIDLIEYRAKALVLKGEWETGTAEYKKIVHREDVSFEAKLRIASAYVAQSVADSSLVPLAQEILFEIDKDTTDWQVNAMLGELFSQEQNDSLGAIYLIKATELAEWNSDVWIRLGALLFDNQRFAEAAEHMQKAVTHFPNDYAINFILGFSLSQETQHEDAEKYLSKAVLLNPNDDNSLAVYAFTLNQLGKEDEALKYIKRALAINENNSQLLGMAGMIYDNKEMWTECDAAYEKALAIDSTDALINNNYAYSLSERGIQLERALKMVNIAIEADPENSSYLDTIGWIYYKLGDYVNAEKYINKAIEVDIATATLYDHIGDVYYKQGKKKEALEAWQIALDMDSENETIKSKIEKGGL